MDETVHHNRREEDRDRMLNTRLDRLEDEYRNLTAKVGELSATIHIVKLEQYHLKDLFDARLKVIEKSQELQLSKTDQIGKDIAAMGSDVNLSPAGRSLQSQVSESKETINRHEQIHENLLRWQHRVDGILILLQWIGAAGLIGAVIAVLRTFKVIP